MGRKRRGLKRVLHNVGVTVARGVIAATATIVLAPVLGPAAPAVSSGIAFGIQKKLNHESVKFKHMVGVAATAAAGQLVGEVANQFDSLVAQTLVQGAGHAAIAEATKSNPVVGFCSGAAQRVVGHYGRGLPAVVQMAAQFAAQAAIRTAARDPHPLDEPFNGLAADLVNKTVECIKAAECLRPLEAKHQRGLQRDEELRAQLAPLNAEEAKCVAERIQMYAEIERLEAAQGNKERIAQMRKEHSAAMEKHSNLRRRGLVERKSYSENLQELARSTPEYHKALEMYSRLQLEADALSHYIHETLQHPELKGLSNRVGSHVLGGSDRMHIVGGISSPMAGELTRTAQPEPTYTMPDGVSTCTRTEMIRAIVVGHNPLARLVAKMIPSRATRPECDPFPGTRGTLDKLLKLSASPGYRIRRTFAAHYEDVHDTLVEKNIVCNGLRTSYTSLADMKADRDILTADMAQADSALRPLISSVRDKLEECIREAEQKSLDSGDR